LHDQGEVRVGKVGALVLMFPVSALAQNGPPVAPGTAPADTATDKPAMAVNCADWTKQPDGNWQSGPNGTLTYPTRQGSFADVSIGQHMMNLGGVDPWQFVEDHCGSSGR
jgi:hypothetical protein